MLLLLLLLFLFSSATFILTYFLKHSYCNHRSGICESPGNYNYNCNYCGLRQKTQERNVTQTGEQAH